MTPYHILFIFISNLTSTTQKKVFRVAFYYSLLSCLVSCQSLTALEGQWVSFSMGRMPSATNIVDVAHCDDTALEINITQDSFFFSFGREHHGFKRDGNIVYINQEGVVMNIVKVDEYSLYIHFVDCPKNILRDNFMMCHRKDTPYSILAVDEVMNVKNETADYATMIKGKWRFYADFQIRTGQEAATVPPDIEPSYAYAAFPCPINGNFRLEYAALNANFTKDEFCLENEACVKYVLEQDSIIFGKESDHARFKIVRLDRAELWIARQVKEKEIELRCYRRND